jgi:hypothetical protein
LGKSGEKASALCEQDLSIDDCIGCKSMGLTVLDAENISWQMECDDLSTTIRQELVCANRALSYLVYVLGWFCFSKNSRTSFKLPTSGILAG